MAAEILEYTLGLTSLVTTLLHGVEGNLSKHVVLAWYTDPPLRKSTNDLRVKDMINQSNGGLAALVVADCSFRTARPGSNYN